MLFFNDLFPQLKYCYANIEGYKRDPAFGYMLNPENQLFRKPKICLTLPPSLTRIAFVIQDPKAAGFQ